jgi:CubicO group peptidase (beta-lactamase class C family)
MPVRGLLVVAALLVSVPASAIAAPKASASNSQFQLNKARIDKTLAQMVADGRAAGTSALVWKDGREVYFGSAGYADRET